MTRKKHSKESCAADGHSRQPGHRCLGVEQEGVSTVDIGVTESAEAQTGHERETVHICLYD